MATGQVSSITGDNWQLIATNTPTSGTSTTVSSITGYKRLMIVVKNITMTSATYYSILTFNSDTGNNYSSLTVNGSLSDNRRNAVTFDISNSATGARSGVLYVENVLGIGAKTFTGTTGNVTNGYAQTSGAWINDSAITSVTFTSVAGTNTFTAGTFSVYGIAA
jgi:hypothetical protein